MMGGFLSNTRGEIWQKIEMECRSEGVRLEEISTSILIFVLCSRLFSPSLSHLGTFETADGRGANGGEEEDEDDGDE